MQCIVRQSKCIAPYFQLLQLLRLTDRWSPFPKTRMNPLMGQRLLLCAIKKRERET